MTLAIHLLDDQPDPAAVPFIFVHGFTQNAACMEPFAGSVASAVAASGASARIAMIDAPGHGESEHDRADLIDAARLLVDAGGRGHYVGYSMGGRMLLHAALLFPEQFQSLTLIGATAGIEPATERAQRLLADERLARRLEREGLESFLDFWLGLDLFASLDDEAARRTDRLRNRAAGLASSLRHCGTGNQFPLWSHLRHVEVPIQVIAGTSDAKFTELGERMVDDLAHATFEAVAGGHAVHSESPAAVAELVAEFSRAVSGGDARSASS